MVIHAHVVGSRIGQRFYQLNIKDHIKKVLSQRNLSDTCCDYAIYVDASQSEDPSLHDMLHI